MPIGKQTYFLASVTEILIHCSSIQRRKLLNTTSLMMFGSLSTARYRCVTVNILTIQVYDVTPYVEDHPGGDAILNDAGGDATIGFNRGQHPENVSVNIIPDFLIGVLKKD